MVKLIATINTHLNGSGLYQFYLINLLINQVVPLNEIKQEDYLNNTYRNHVWRGAYFV